MGCIEWIHVVNLRLDLVARILDFARVNQLLKLRLDIAGYLLLLLITAKNSRSVLRANVVTLSVLCRWIMEHEKELNELFKVLLRLVELDIENFNVTSRARTDLC